MALMSYSGTFRLASDGNAQQIVAVRGVLTSVLSMVEVPANHIHAAVDPVVKIAQKQGPDCGPAIRRPWDCECYGVLSPK